MKFHLGGDMSKHLAPNGKPSNLTHEQWHLVRTPEFKAWFGDWENEPANASKVVDENGEPMVVYHGTRTRGEQGIFSIFDIERGGESNTLAKVGFWFTPIQTFAKNFADNSYWGKEKTFVYAVFIKIKNPKVYTTDDSNYGDSYEKFRTSVYAIDGQSQERANMGGIGYALKNPKETLNKFRESLYSNGFDGIFIKNTRFDRGEAGGNNDQYVVLFPEQIKLANGANTTFDGSNPDIRFDDGGRVEDFIREGIVELKMYDTTPEHAKKYGLDSVNPLYVQSIYISENQRLKGIGKQVLEYINDYAAKNGHDVVFGHITQKAEPSVDVIKSMLVKSGFNTCEGNNDFYRIIGISDIRYNDGGLIAPNGNKSNLTAEQYKLVRTKAFKDWFGDWENDRENSGKVSGITREPSVWYHSTKTDFLSKKGENIFRNPPFFFALRKDISEDIVRIQHQNFKGRIITKAFFVRYKNPFDITKFRILSDKKLTKIIKENTLLNSEKEIKIFQIQLGQPNIYKNTWALTESEAVQGWIKSKGYDSFFVYEDGARNLAVFEPNQIKLADGSNTTFDGGNPDIRFDDGGEVNCNSFMKWYVQWYKGISAKMNIVFYLPSVIAPYKEQNVVVLDVFEKKDQTIDAKPYLETIAEKANEYDVVIYLEAKDNIEQYQKFGFQFTPNKQFMKRLPKSNPDIRYDNGGTMKKVDKGGITYGKSHKEGGIPVKNASTGSMLEVEGGEGIVNKRSMASDRKVKMNGKEMTICEAVSQLNQMEGGVKFSCDDVEHRQFIEQMELGGELERGKRTEREHIETLQNLYKNRLTPNQAVAKIAKDHLKEDPKYYSKLAKMEGKMAGGGMTSKEEKRLKIAEMKRNFIEKAKDGKKVENNDTPVYPKINKYSDFFNTMNTYQENYRKAVNSHEKTLSQGLRLKTDNTIPKKEKEKQLDILREELVADKDKLKKTRGDLAQLPKMESPFYAPKLAEGGQIVSGITTLRESGITGDNGALAIKPVKDDVSIYKFPKMGFDIEWVVREDGTYKFGALIGKRSLGNEVVMRMSQDNYNRNIVKSEFLRIIAHKSNYEFQFSGKASEPLDAVTKFINFLRFHGNSNAFLTFYNPDTQSVYSGSEGATDERNIDLVLSAVMDNIKYTLLYDVYNIEGKNFENLSNVELISLFQQHYLKITDIYEDFQKMCKSVVDWKKRNPDFNEWTDNIKNATFHAYETLRIENLYCRNKYIFSDDESSLAVVMKRNTANFVDLSFMYREKFRGYLYSIYDSGRVNVDIPLKHLAQNYGVEQSEYLQLICYLYLIKK